MVDDAVFSRSEFMIRVVDFTDALLYRVKERSKEKGADDRDVGMLGNILLKSLRIWDRESAESAHDTRPRTGLRKLEKQAAEILGTSKE